MCGADGIELVVEMVNNFFEYVFRLDYFLSGNCNSTHSEAVIVNMAKNLW